MKKLMLASFGLALSFASFATSTTSFVYDGSNPSFVDTLNGEETHTEYRTESTPSTCYRNEIAGYRMVCSGGYYGGGYYGGGYYGPRGPRYNGGYYGTRVRVNTNCFNEPYYRTVAYSCTQTTQIPYTVKDFDVVAQVAVNVINSSDKAANETISLSLGKNGLVSLKAVGSKNFLVVLKNKKEDIQTAGSVKTIVGTYDVELVDVAALKALEVKNLNASFTGVTYNYAALDKSGLVATSLKIEKRRFLAKKKLILNAELMKTDINATGVAADIKFANLGLDMKKGRYVFTVTTEIKTEGKLLNASQFGGQLVKTVELKKKIK